MVSTMWSHIRHSPGQRESCSGHRFFRTSFMRLRLRLMAGGVTAKPQVLYFHRGLSHLFVYNYHKISYLHFNFEVILLDNMILNYLTFQ